MCHIELQAKLKHQKMNFSLLLNSSVDANDVLQITVFWERDFCGCGKGGGQYRILAEGISLFDHWKQKILNCPVEGHLSAMRVAGVSVLPPDYKELNTVKNI